MKTNRKFVVEGRYLHERLGWGFQDQRVGSSPWAGEIHETTRSKTGTRNGKTNEMYKTSSGPVIRHWAEPRKFYRRHRRPDPAIGGMKCLKMGRRSCVDGAARDGICGASRNLARSLVFGAAPHG